MKLTIVIIFLLSLLGGGFRTITSINQYASSAATNYRNGQYAEAIAAYTYLLDDLEVDDNQLRLNLAHAYFKAGKLSEAVIAYQLLADNPSHRLRAISHLQLGCIATKQKKYKQALALFKQALIADPTNEEARYNFELLKKFLDQNPEKAAEAAEPDDFNPEEVPADSSLAPPSAKEEPQPKKKPDSAGDQEEEIEQPEPDKKGEEAKGGSSDRKNKQPPIEKEKEQATGKEEGDEEGLNLESQFDPLEEERKGGYEEASKLDQRAQTQRARLQKANISPDRAKILLEAMRNAELQYIQQLPKKSKKKPAKGMPDW